MTPLPIKPVLDAHVAKRRQQSAFNVAGGPVLAFVWARGRSQAQAACEARKNFLNALAVHALYEGESALYRRTLSGEALEQARDVAGLNPIAMRNLVHVAAAGFTVSIVSRYRETRSTQAAARRLCPR